jgi:hypothetical protein
MVVTITPNDNGPPGKLADVERHFSGGALDGTELIAFRICKRRGDAGSCCQGWRRRPDLNRGWRFCQELTLDERPLRPDPVEPLLTPADGKNGAAPTAARMRERAANRLFAMPESRSLRRRKFFICFS